VPGPRFASPTAAHPYRHGIALAAASIKEKAKDIGKMDLEFFPTYDEQPHGAFTDSLLRVLTGREPGDANQDGVLTYRELYDSVLGHMRRRGYNHRPVMLPRRSEALADMTERSLFGAATVAPPPPPRQIHA
jgi:hypothetical protein